MAQLLRLKLEDASLDEIAELALRAIGPNAAAKKNIDVKDVSGNSGAKTYVCSLHKVPKCIVKVSSSKSFMSLQPITQKSSESVARYSMFFDIKNLLPSYIKGTDLFIHRYVVEACLLK